MRVQHHRTYPLDATPGAATMTTPGIYKLERYAGNRNAQGQAVPDIKLVSPPTKDAAERVAQSIFEQTGIRWDVVAG